MNEEADLDVMQINLNLGHSEHGLSSFSEVEGLFGAYGVEEIYIKRLAAKQDNDKNQIYFGDGLGGVANLFPGRLSVRSASTSTEKRKSSKGRVKLESLLDFEWLDRAGNSYPAPGAKIIDYFQFPEVRFSGFLKGCQNSPDALRRTKQAEYGQRILVMGSNDVGKTYGLVLTEVQDPIVAQFPELLKLIPVCESAAVFNMHSIGSALGADPKALLVQELTSISGTWHPSVSLRPGDAQPIPFKGNQGGGYTLEALLGVSRNAIKAPDKHGFELKAFKKSGKISLMTPTADCGKEGEMSFRDFMDSYGWPGARGDGRIVFNGIHRFHKPNKSTGYVLDITGYDIGTDRFSEQADEIVVALMKPVEDLMISGWTFTKLLDSWSEKHVAACYVEYDKRRHIGPNHDADYLYTGRTYFANGTTIFHYLRAIASDVVYYDAGHEISANGSAHQRPQWRISVTSRIHERLARLYNEVEEKQLI